MTPVGRPAVEVLFGAGGDAAAAIERDFKMLVSPGDATTHRVWTCETVAVVLGASRNLQAEVDLTACQELGVAVLRRASGGGTVVISPGTVQYALALPHPADAPAPSLDVVKAFASRVVCASLAEAAETTAILSDPSGDLRRGPRKVAGVALRRQRSATLLHGTILVDADLEHINRVLLHPEREPAWRGGRSHLDFLENLGRLDLPTFEKALAVHLEDWPAKT